MKTFPTILSNVNKVSVQISFKVSVQISDKFKLLFCLDIRSKN